MDFIAGLLLGGVSRFAGRGGHGGRAISREHLGHGVPKKSEDIKRKHRLFFVFNVWNSVNICLYFTDID